MKPRACRHLPRATIAGGGIAAVEAALTLRERAPSIGVTLIADTAALSYRALSALVPFGTKPARSIPLSHLAQRGVEIVQARVEQVDTDNRSVLAGGDRRISYDALFIGLGARRVAAFDHACTFRGPEDAEGLSTVIRDFEARRVTRLAFVVPEGVSWSLPLYELALQFAWLGRSLRSPGVELLVVTPEQRPLEVFGHAGAALLETLLRDAGIELVTAARPAVLSSTTLRTHPGASPRVVDKIVALPRLEGRPIDGLPAHQSGFLPVDPHGRVIGATGVYAAGDGVHGPMKQGGVAAQQADLAVATLLADRGLGPREVPEPLQLRGLLIAGKDAWYLRRQANDENGVASRTPLWWPPSKVAGRRLAPFIESVCADDPGPGRRRDSPPGLRRRAVVLRGNDGRAAITPLEPPR